MADNSLARRMETAKLSTSLLNLPAEIWSKIGKLIIDDNRIITGAEVSARCRTRWHQPPITRTCRALREELLPYLYATKFVGWFFLGRIPDLGKWLRALDPEMRRAIGGLCTETSMDTVAYEERRLRETWEVEMSLVLIEEKESPVGPWRKYVVRFE